MSRDAVGRAFVCVLLAGAVVYVSMYLLASSYSNPRAVYTLDGFRAQYEHGVFAYRILAREALLWINAWLFDGGRLYDARVVLNAVSLAVFNLAFLALLHDLGIEARFQLPAVLLADLLAALSLYVRSNPYTLPVLALVYLGFVFAERQRPVATGTVVVAGILTHEIAWLVVAYWIARSQLREPALPALRLDRAAVRSAALLGVGLVTHLSTRFAIESEALFQDVTLSANLRPRALVVVVLLATILLSFPVRGMVREAGRRHAFHLVVVLATLLPYGALVACFGRLVELRLFLPFLPLVIALFYLTAATPAASEALEGQPGADAGGASQERGGAVGFVAPRGGPG